MTDVRKLVEWLRRRGVRASLVKPRIALRSDRSWLTAGKQGMSRCHG
ncbi:MULTISPECIES: hypothetical protein [Geobacillus]|uniref:TnpR resolvase n=1 Tax=Geobacillus icigianus TaxID=1430331 RepID=A0ABU6BG51_9BACL|nr:MULTISPECIES: hypothetical protein [Geobacillus]KYD29189.1 hypothetical protein B4113_2343 [Geobacillus sp. B4113_201601]MEB3750950.1 hypothetical protein [Geobacillus icigianus]TWG31935.1 hypothetical protein GC56T2_3197 [Geobacillus sp. C56-T2]